MSERGVPQILYKYYPPAGVEYALEGQSLRFSSPLTFNDVFDCRYLSDHRYAGTRQSKFRRGLGVVCLTETATNHLMWVHYAQGHRGFVLGFNTAHEFFQMNRPQPVSYDPLPPALEGCAGPDLVLTVHKALEWQYEQEWRIARKFSQSESRDIEFPVEALRAVVLGAEMEQHLRARAVQDLTELKSSNPNVELYEACPNPKSWTIEIKQSFLLQCPTCNGSGVRCHTCNGSGLTHDVREIELQRPPR
jgi:hypothetical protein